MANYTSNTREYINNIITDVLPISDLQYMEVTKSGLVPLDATNSTQLKTELPNSKKIYAHEKCTTTRFGILAQNSNPESKIFHPHYIRPFDSSNIFDKIIVQSILELYPTPVSTYGVVVNPYNTPIVGAGVVDLNHLETADEHQRIQSFRFDMVLHSIFKKKDINSFIDLQQFLNDEKAKNLFTPRALTQLALSTFFIPNAIGELDANSRNIILLFNPTTKKVEHVVRIDAESNTYLNDINNERSGKKIIPKGIFSANESLESEFLKSISERDSSVDWNLFGSFLYLTELLTSRDKIDAAITKGYFHNYGKVDTPFESAIVRAKFGIEPHSDFSKATIERVKRYNEKIYNAMSRINSLPYETEIEKNNPQKLKIIDYDQNGKEL